MSDSSPLLFLLHVSGAAALLLWAVRLVRTGVERGWSIALRKLLRRGAQNRLFSAGLGLTAAVLLQSSTAVAILTGNFVSTGTLPAVAGLATMLGADVGSAIVAQILMTRADWLIPILLVAGVGFFLRGRQRNTRMMGRILIGLALIFVSLGMLRDATEPLRESPGLISAMGYLGGDPMTAFVIGALLAWMMYSSVAAVLMFVTLAAQGVLPATAAVAMVLGANLGGAAIAFMLTLGSDLAARRVILSNLVLRGSGALIALLCLVTFAPPLTLLGETAAQQAINLHLVFNLGLALLALPFAGPILRLVGGWVRAPADTASLSRMSALDTAALRKPERALACAAREVLTMGEIIEAMLRSVITLFHKWEDDAAAAITAKEAEVRRMHLAIKLYLAEIQRISPDAETNQRVMELAEMAVNMDGAGNAISESMLALAERLHQEGTHFSASGWQEIADFHDRVLSNVQAALNVLMTVNPDAARALVEEKDHVRDIEQQLQRSHLARLREGLPESIETSSVHQETLRALKQINSAFTTIAYPILAETGDLLRSRLNKGGAA